MKQHYIIKIFHGCVDLVGMRKTKEEAEALLIEHGRSEPNGGSITPIESDHPWYNGVD